MNIDITKAEVNVLNLQPNDTLVFKLTTAEKMSDAHRNSLQLSVQDMFPDNQVLLFTLLSTSSLELEIVKSEGVIPPPPPSEESYEEYVKSVMDEEWFRKLDDAPLANPIEQVDLLNSISEEEGKNGNN